MAHWSIYLSFFDAYIERRRERRGYRISLAKLPSCSNYSVPVITICVTECLVLTLADLVSCWGPWTVHYFTLVALEPMNPLPSRYNTAICLDLGRTGSHSSPLLVTSMASEATQKRRRKNSGKNGSLQFFGTRLASPTVLLCSGLRLQVALLCGHCEPSTYVSLLYSLCTVYI